MLRASLYSVCLGWLSVCALAEEVARLSVDDRAARLPELATKFYQPLIDGQWAQGLVVGVIDERGPRVFGFGRKGENLADAPDGDSVFEIGSVTKVFTGILLADMAERGLVSVDDPVNKLLPDDIGPLRCAGREMRLVDLATHTSGLPRLPPNWAPKDPTEPYVDYTDENLLAFLREQGKPAPLSSLAGALSGLISSKPKQEWAYSNLGVGLLGTLLARKAGRPYEELVVERICVPLVMSSTRLTLDEAQTARLVPGHDADGNPAKNWKFACLGPAGGICSTSNDMLKFLAANLEPNDTPLAAALAKAQQPHYTRDSQFDMGLNWLLVKPDLVFHNGMTGGYNSFVAFSKPHKLGVVVLADTAIGTGGLLDRVSMSFIKALTEDKPRGPPKLRSIVPVDRAILQKYAGKYTLVPLVATITVTCEEDRLYAVLTGQDRYRIYPESDTKFFYKVVDAQITFERGESGNVERLILHQNGKDQRAARKDEE